MRISFEEGLQRLVAKGKVLSRSRGVEQNDVQPTSIRLKRATKHYVECQAEALNTSVQSVIHMILDGAAEAESDETLAVLRVMRERFLYLLRAHQIDFPQAVSVLKHHGFTLSSFGDENRLLDLMTETVLRFLSDIFHVHRGWLSGVNNSITTTRGWYKHSFPTAQTLLHYSIEGLHPHVIFVRRTDAVFADGEGIGQDQEEIGFVVRLSRSTDDSVTFDTFEKWEFVPWSHNNSRREALAIIAFCEAAQSAGRLSYAGYQLPKASLDALRSGRTLPVELLKAYSSIWHPDDYSAHSGKKEVQKLLQLLERDHE